MELKIALAGNPNCGKTTLFNQLTGSNQYVGNWPGVIVEKKDDRISGNKDVIIQDLPGIYSLSPYTLEEVVSRQYLVHERPDAIINIVDGTNIERNLYLTTQILELNIPTVVAVNMVDLVRKKGDVIDYRKLSKTLGCEVVPISALKKEGGKELVQKAIEAAKSGKVGQSPEIYQGPVQQAVAQIEELIKPFVSEENRHWYGVKLFERDEKVLESLKLNSDVAAEIDKLVTACETEMDDDAESIITAQRYEYITGIIGGTLVKKAAKGALSASDKIDRIVTNRILALPIFAAVMFLVYFISITTIGTKMTDWTNDVLFAEWIQPSVQSLLENAGAANWVVSLVVDGIIGGIGAPIGFAPQMAMVFLCLSILEDCGYMSRVAFVMDRIFRGFGVSGKSFIPFLISSGCAVPGIMATRTIENEKDRRMTMMTTTLIPCGAKLPVIASIAGFCMGGAWWAAPACYLAGIVLVIVSCIILKKMKMFAGKPAPFVMELPQYHIPSVKGVLIHVWERIWAFLKKAGTILFLCCVVMWLLSSFGFHNGTFGLVEPEHSLMAAIGGAIAIVFAPLGFDTWQAVASSISGFVAKEGIISTMGVLAGVGEIEEISHSMRDSFVAFFPSTIAAVSFLSFNLFNSPCLAAISTTAKEIGSRKFFWFAIAFQNIFSYAVALMVYQFGGLATGVVSFGAGTIAALIVLAIILYLLFRPDPTKKLKTAAAENM